MADGLTDITEALKAQLKKTKSVDDAVLKVVKESLKESSPVRFEGNNYAEQWVTEAEKRTLPNYRRTPNALAQLSRGRCSRRSVSLPSKSSSRATPCAWSATSRTC